MREGRACASVKASRQLRCFKPRECPAYADEFPEWKRCLKIRPLSMFVLLLMTLVLMIVTFALYMQLQDSLENPNPAYDYDVLRWLFNGSLELPLRTVLGSGLNGIL